MVWSQLASALYWRARADLEPDEVRRVTFVALLLAIGGAAPLCALSAEPAVSATVAALWIGFAVLLWTGAKLRALLLPLAVLGAAALRTPTAALPGAIMAALLLSIPTRPTLATLRWVLRQLPALEPYVLYGLAQGLILWTLLKRTDWTMLPGLGIFVVALLITDVLVLRLKSALARSLWREAQIERFIRSAQLRVVAYAACCTLPSVAIAVLAARYGGDAAWLRSAVPLALFAAALGLGLAHMCLVGPRLASLGLAVGAALAGFGAPEMLAIGVALAALFVTMLAALQRVQRYGVELI